MERTNENRACAGLIYGWRLLTPLVDNLSIEVVVSALAHHQDVSDAIITRGPTRRPMHMLFRKKSGLPAYPRVWVHHLICASHLATFLHRR